MKDEATPAKVRPNDGLGVCHPERAESLREMIARLERQQFEEWAIRERYAERDHTGLWFFGQHSGSTLWVAWQARGLMQVQCRGVAHHGCNYLAACGGVCNKCGQSV